MASAQKIDIKVVSVKKDELRKRGIRDVLHWKQNGTVLYIGRNMSHYVAGTEASKWGNPFAVKKYGLEKCLELYENHIRNTPDLWNSIEELANYRELGCWCKTAENPSSPCHGDVLLKLLQEKLNSKS